MFAEGFKCETQVIAFVLSADTEMTRCLRINAASAALTLPISHFLPDRAVALGLVEGRFIRHPHTLKWRMDCSHHGRRHGCCDCHDRVGREEVKEETVVDAIEFAHTEIKKICAAINELRSKVGKPKRKVTAAGIRRMRTSRGLESKIGKQLSDASRYPEASESRKLRTRPHFGERACKLPSPKTMHPPKAKRKSITRHCVSVFPHSGDRSQAPP